MKDLEVLALIPARGGSKGLPHKNILPLAGIPLVAHSILQAIESVHVSRVVVTSDDEVILSVAEAHGADTVRRPAELASDHSTSESALQHAIESLEATEGYRPGIVVFLQCTSPFRTPDDIDKAVERLISTGADALLSVVPLEGFTWELCDGDFEPLTYNPDERPRRQELGRQVVENGSIYVFRPEVLFETGSRIGGRVVEFLMPPMSIFQIDHPEDLDLHERLLPLQPWRPRPPGLEEIRLCVFDFDGVMTDDRVWVDENGRESVACNRADGLGLERLRAAGIEAMVISKESNPVVAARCEKLAIPCHQGVDDKLSVLQKITRDRGLVASQVCFVGNDVNDTSSIEWAGCGITVENAPLEVRAAASWTTTKRGGAGAVREVCELILDTVAARGSRND